MTAGNDGNPESDDPFGYLYRSEDGQQQPDPAAGQPGVPRTSYHQVQRVGERRPAPQSGYGYPPQQPQGGGYGYPQPGSAPQQSGQGGGGYGYPPQAPYGQPQQGQQQYGGQPGHQQQSSYDFPQGPSGGRRGGPDGGPDGDNRKGLLIAAVAVVVAVAIGIAFAMTNGSGDKNKPDAQNSTAASSSTAPSAQPSTPAAEDTPFASDKVDASTLTLAGAAAAASQVPGASASGGTYVAVAAQGDGATWTVTVPKKGDYTFFISYGNTGGDATLSLTVNGKPRDGAVNMSNWSKSNDPTKAWYTTYSFVDLSKGANTLSLSCTPTDTNCAVDLDQVWLKQGQVKK